MSLVYPVRLRSIEAYIASVHGSPRPLSAEEILVVDDYAGRMIDDVQDAWPVDTSTSRDAWVWETSSEVGEVGFVLLNDTPYVQYVHLAGQPADPPLWETLLPAVVGSYADDLLRDLRAAVDRTEAEARRNAAQGGRGFIDVIARLLRPATGVLRVG